MLYPFLIALAYLKLHYLKSCDTIGLDLKQAAKDYIEEHVEYDPSKNEVCYDAIQHLVIPFVHSETIHHKLNLSYAAWKKKRIKGSDSIFLFVVTLQRPSNLKNLTETFMHS